MLLWFKNNRTLASFVDTLHNLWKERKANGLITNLFGWSCSALVLLHNVRLWLGLPHEEMPYFERALMPPILSLAVLQQSYQLISDFFCAYERSGVYLVHHAAEHDPPRP